MSDEYDFSGYNFLDDDTSYDYGNDTNPVYDYGDDYDFYESIGINPDTLSSFSDSPSNQQILKDIGYTGTDFSSAGVGNFLKGLVSTGGNIDYGKLLTLGGGALAMGRSNNRTQPSGYQGKIPTLTATRQAPGPDGKLSGDVVFTPKGIAAAPALTAPAMEAPQSLVSTPDASRLLDTVNAGNTPVGAPRPYDAPERNMQPVVSDGTEQPYAKGGALESGGFVIPADVVSHLGNGSSEAGLRLLAQRYGAAPIKGKGDGMSDSIKTTIDGQQPARVANEEARLTKAQVQAAGGAKKLYAMMDRIRHARTGSKEQGKQINPGKFMPGGAVGYSAGGITSFQTGGTTTVPAGTTGTESNLSNWAGEYVTNMLGKGQALSEMPYEQYKGPLTADASKLQSNLSTGFQNLSFPGVLGQSFSSTTAPTIGGGGQPTGGTGIASNYMNPYLSNVLNPQLAEMRRQAEINNQSSLGGLTKSGAFGGGRQAIMESEAGRNLLNTQNTAIGKGYSDAFDKGMQQFNIEQGQAKDLVGLMASQGAVDRGITAEDVAAQQKQFEEARLNPYKMVQFQQSLLSGLPLAAQTYNQAPTDNLTQFSRAATTIDNLLKNLNQVPPTTPPN